MQHNNFIFLNRFHTFYFRQRTPLDILKAIPHAKNEIKISLRTKCRAMALIDARQHKVMFDLLFTQIRESITNMEKTKASFNELDETIQRELMLKQRAVEAINDQQLTQQLFFLLERKSRIKNAFEHIEALQPYSLCDIDLSSVDKINHFIAIVDLLSSPHLSDPTPYIEQLKFKQRSASSSSSGALKAVNIARLVVKRQKRIPLAETPAQLTKQAKASRNSTSDALVEMIN